MAKQSCPANPISHHQQRQQTKETSKATSRSPTSSSSSNTPTATATATATAPSIVSANRVTTPAWKGGNDNHSSATTSTVESDYSSSELSATSASFNPTGFSSKRSSNNKNKGGAALTWRTESPGLPAASASNNGNNNINNIAFMMATGHGHSHSKSYDSYGYEDATPDVANRYNNNNSNNGGNPAYNATPPRDYGWTNQRHTNNYNGSISSGGSSNNDARDHHRRSYHGNAGGDPSDGGINLHEFDQATTLDRPAGVGPRRATMTYGESYNSNAPPGFTTPGGLSRSRSGSDDSDFLTSLISSSSQDGGGLPTASSLQRRSSLQEGGGAYSNMNNDLMVGGGMAAADPMVAQFASTAHRRNSLQEALARSGSTNNPTEQQMHRQQQHPNATKWDNHQHHPPPQQHHPHHHHHHGGDTRRSSLPSSMGQQGSMGSYNQGRGGGPIASRSHRYDQPYHGPTGAGGYGNPPPRVPPPAGPLYTVKLKRNQRTFVLGPRIKSKLVTGTYVKVEADRGEDLGIVIGEAAPDQLEMPSRRASYGGFEQARRASSGGGGGGGGGRDHHAGRDQPKKILRLASREEVALLATRRQEEDEMHQLCVQKVRERGLDMRIVDAEYQFDRNKLTFYFEAERRVDFRDLVRELFMICGTRIWMCQINTYATSTASRPSNESHDDDEDVNVPIIAPPSEFLS